MGYSTEISFSIYDLRLPRQKTNLFVNRKLPLMNPFDDELNQRLKTLSDQGLRRELRAGDALFVGQYAHHNRDERRQEICE